VPIIAGRDIQEGDQSGSLKPCVINQAFAKQFFEERNPLGMHITVHEDEKPITFVIVGVAKNAHTQNLRREVPPRFYAYHQADWPAPFFLIRTAAEAGPILAVARKTIQRFDPDLIQTARTIEEQIAPATSQEQSVARIATVFGCVALALSAIGL